LPAPSVPVGFTRQWLSILPAWYWLGLTAGFAARLVGAWTPLETSLTLSVPDDAYYYFTIARNIIAGSGVTSDGIYPTNGFHPLWMAVLIPIWWLFGESLTLPVHVALTAGAILDVAALLVISSLTYRWTQDPTATAFSSLVYALNPYSISSAVNGLETSLGIVVLALFISQYWYLRDDRRNDIKPWVVFGSLAGLLLMARSDYILVLLFISFELLWSRRRSLSLRGLVSATSSASLICFPWLWWNAVTFGSIVQVSGKAYPYYQHMLWRAGEHTLADLIGREVRISYEILANAGMVAGLGKAIVILGIGSLFIVLFGRDLRGEQATQLSWNSRLKVYMPLLVPTLGVVVNLLVHGLVRWHWVPWYFTPLTILVVLWVAISVQWICNVKRSLGLGIAGALVMYQVWSGGALLMKGGMWPQQHSPEDMLAGYVEHCSITGSIGITDSGYAGYYLPCRVVNLDGVVNNRAFESIEQHRFRRYLDEIGIGFAGINPIVQDVVTLSEGAVPSTPPFAARP
jgi:hypothetical protein